MNEAKTKLKRQLGISKHKFTDPIVSLLNPFCFFVFFWGGGNVNARFENQIKKVSEVKSVAIWYLVKRSFFNLIIAFFRFFLLMTE